MPAMRPRLPSIITFPSQHPPLKHLSRIHHHHGQKDTTYSFLVPSLPLEDTPLSTHTNSISLIIKSRFLRKTQIALGVEPPSSARSASVYHFTHSAFGHCLSFSLFLFWNSLLYNFTLRNPCNCYHCIIVSIIVHLFQLNSQLLVG